MRQNKLLCHLGALILSITTVTAAESSTITLEAYKATSTSLLLKVKISDPLACWGIVFSENNYYGILTSTSVTYGSLSDTPVFNNVHNPFFMGIKQQARTWNSLLFFGKISPPKVDTKSPYKFISLKLDGSDKTFGKEKFTFKFGYCLAQAEKEDYYKDVLKNVKITDQDFTLLPEKNDETLKVDFSFDEADIDESSKKPAEKKTTISKAAEEKPKTHTKKENGSDYTPYIVYGLLGAVAIVILIVVLKRFRVVQNEQNLESIKEDKIENLYK
eukprot:GAHX01000671.1.p1 GENE.GAHX01000671.1~~GAHX01000671.1.p1  ORF type:complete len:290 (+),score=56.21 GAHX01000671.1:52-870(+)